MGYRKSIILVFFVFIVIFGNAQNLVLNHSFEDAWSCPYSFVTLPIGQPYPQWINPNKGTPDYLHVCSTHDAGVPENFAGNMYPSEGAAYAGIILREIFNDSLNVRHGVSREYIQTKLSEPLRTDKLYCVKLFYSNASKSAFSVDALGITLTKDKIGTKDAGLIIQMPQVINKPGHIMDNTDYWQELCGVYRAKGNEKYLTIGNFWNNSETNFKMNGFAQTDSSFVYAYYFIDDVRIFEIENTFECGCLNDLSYGSDYLADNYDNETGYNSLDIDELALNSGNNDNNSNSDGNSDGNNNGDNGNNSNSDNNSDGNNNGDNDNNSNSDGNSDGNNNGDNGNNSNSDGNSDGNNNGDNGNNSNSDGNSDGNNNGDNGNNSNSNNNNNSNNNGSEINLTAFENINIGDKFNLNRIFFEFNSSELLTASYYELGKLYEILNGKSNLRIEIRGHTDNIGSDRYNKKLSVNRAGAVYEYLIEKGIDKTRMKYRGFGNKVPIASNDTEEGRGKNRRVEIIIVEL